MTPRRATGTATVNNVWKATCSALADQSGNGLHAVQAAAASQPVLTTGLNGVAGLAFDGVDDFLACASFNLPAPGTTPTFVWSVFRLLNTPASNAVLVSGHSGIECMIYVPGASAAVTQYNTNNVNVLGAVVGSWYRDEVYFSNSTADYQKLGPSSATGANAGNNDPITGRSIGATDQAIAPSKFELLAMLHTNNLPSVGQLAAASAAATSKYGGSVAV